jgi:hypothetical protein
VVDEDEDLSHVLFPLSSFAAQMTSWATRNSAIFDAAVAFVGDDCPAVRGGLRCEVDNLTVDPALARPTLSASIVEVGDAQGLHRLLLGGHDALERRVARLVDLLDHADHGGQGGLDLGEPSSV